MTASTAIEYGMNRPMTIKLPNCYFDILELMAHLYGEDIEQLAKERLQQIIIEDITLDEEFWGELLCKSWRESLKDDPYYKGTVGK